MKLSFYHRDEDIPQRMSALVTMPLFPTENLNIQGRSLQISLMSLYLQICFSAGVVLVTVSSGTHYRGCFLYLH